MWLSLLVFMLLQDFIFTPYHPHSLSPSDIISQVTSYVGMDDMFPHLTPDQVMSQLLSDWHCYCYLVTLLTINIGAGIWTRHFSVVITSLAVLCVVSMTNCHPVLKLSCGAALLLSTVWSKVAKMPVKRTLKSKSPQQPGTLVVQPSSSWHFAIY